MLPSNVVLVVFIVVLMLLITKKVEKFTVSRPSKCFSCEREIIRKSSVLDVWKALPTKCFDCEAGKAPYYTGPTKCFDCDFFKGKRPIYYDS